MAEQSRYTDPETMVVRTPCASCVHRFANPALCKAFPQGIPRAIRDGDNDHTKPFPGDNGIRYERRK